MRTSDSIKELAGALAKAQAIMAGASKDKTNPAFRSKYADLASVWDACRDPLTKHGLSVVQMTRPSDAQEVVVVTRLMHSSGEWMESELALPVTKNDAQGFGSALTYTRRYALSAMVGVAPEEDDGNAAAAAKPTPLPAAIPANTEGRQMFEQMTPELKDYYSSHARALEKLSPQDGDTYIEQNKFNPEERLVLWHLLPANVRNPIKEAAKARREREKVAA